MDVTRTLVSAEPVDDAEARSELWWMFLVTGALWLVFSLLVFQFDETSVNAIAVLVGVACFGAAAVELALVSASSGAWRLLRVGLAIGFAIVGIIALTSPGDSFDALAAIFAFYLLLRGLFEVGAALMARTGGLVWWLRLAVGVLQILLAFWAAGNFGHKAFLLVVWVGATALAHGLVLVVRAFELRPHPGSAKE